MKREFLEFSRVNPAAYNPREKLTPDDREWKEIEQSLKDFGQVQDLVFNVATGNLVGGHQRMRIMQHRGETGAHFTIVDLPLEEEKRLNLILNKVSGRWDRRKLEDILAEFRGAGRSLENLGFKAVELNSLFKTHTKRASRDPDDAPPPNPDDIAQTQAGQLYELKGPLGASHTLLCMDSRDAAAWPAANSMRLLFTDPPYGVAYNGSTRGDGRIKRPAIEADALKKEDLHAFLAEVFAHAHAAAMPKAAAYVFYACRFHSIFEAALNDSKWQVQQQIIWVKAMTLCRMDYHQAHEPMMYGSRAGETPEWFGDRAQKTLFEMTQEQIDGMKKDEAVALLKKLRHECDAWEESRDPASSYIHPTQKPTSLARRAIRNSSMPGDLVVDCFAGSGSTLISAELEGRRSWSIEKSRGHCDAIVKRFVETFENATVRTWQAESRN